MKKLFYLMSFVAVMVLSSCGTDKPGDEPYKTYNVGVKLVYPNGSDYTSIQGVEVKMKNTVNNSEYSATTNADGEATFEVTVGVYDVVATDRRQLVGESIVFNGSRTGVTVTKDWDKLGSTLNIMLQESKLSQIIIKELYFGGCQKNDGSGSYSRDPYAILYNNSDQPATLTNLCFATTIPYNSGGTNKDYNTDGKLFYEAQGWMPAGTAYWTFGDAPVIEPYKQIVVSFGSANDNTVTYTNSVDLSKPEYYVCYDIEKFPLASYHPQPSENIPTSHYLTAYKFPGATSTGWTFSVSSPVFFIFATADSYTPASFAADASKLNLYGNMTSQVRMKIPEEWIVDGMEVFSASSANNQKRLISSIDNGYVTITNYQGYTAYRNVDKAATEAIEGNAGKIVYSYAYGTLDVSGTTDPSGIDAEASIKAGATIIYLDTNNSSNDFHQRKQASLKD